MAIRSPIDYRCIVLPEAEAEKAAQINLDRGYRGLTRAGERKKPGKVWIDIEPPARAGRRSDVALNLLEKERAILNAHLEAWELLARETER